MSWGVILAWWLSGLMWGLTIAQILVADEVVSYQILALSFLALVADFLLFLYFILRNAADNNRRRGKWL